MESIGGWTAESLGVELASMETVFALCAILLLAFNLLGIVLAGWRLTRRDAENDLVRKNRLSRLWCRCVAWKTSRR